MRNIAAKNLLLSVVLLAPLGCQGPVERGEEGSVSQVSEALFSFPNVARGFYPFEIVAAHSNKCIEVEAAASPGNDLQQYTCNGGHNQAWRFDGWVPVEDGAGGAGTDVDNFSPKNFYTDNGAYSFASWQLRDDSSANHNPLIFQDWAEGSGRNAFEFFQQINKSFEIRTQFSVPGATKCVDVHQLSSLNGAVVQQYSCTGGLNQRFHVRPQRVQAAIQRVGTDLCVEVANASTANYANVQQHGCNDPATTSNQRFYLKDIDWTGAGTYGGTYYRIEVAHSGKCLDVANASLTAGANVQQYTCINQDNQKWAVDMDYSATGVPTGFQLRNKHSGKCLDIEGAAMSDGTNIRQATCEEQSGNSPAPGQWFRFFEMN